MPQIKSQKTIGSSATVNGDVTRETNAAQRGRTRVAKELARQARRANVPTICFRSKYLVVRVALDDRGFIKTDQDLHQDDLAAGGESALSVLPLPLNRPSGAMLERELSA